MVTVRRMSGRAATQGVEPSVDVFNDLELAGGQLVQAFLDQGAIAVS